MFKLLQAHEERDPKAVLKMQNKRAQKRLARQEARTQAEEREREAEPARVRDGDKKCAGFEGKRPSNSWSEHPCEQSRQEQQEAIRQMYEELVLQPDVDPGLLEDGEIFRDIITAQLQGSFLDAASRRPAAAVKVPLQDGIERTASHDRVRTAVATARSTDLHSHTVEMPPGPGPGKGSESRTLEPSSLGAWGNRQGLARLRIHGVEPSPADVSRTAGRSGHLHGSSNCVAAPGLLLRFGFGASSCDGDSGGSRGTQLDVAAAGRGLREEQSQQQQRRWLWQPGELGGLQEDFPELRPSAPATPVLGRSRGVFTDGCSSSSSSSGDGASGSWSSRAADHNTEQAQQQQQQHDGHNPRRSTHHPHRRGGGGVHITKHGTHHSGVKVLHAARPGTHAAHGKGDCSTSPGGLDGCNGSDASDDVTTDINLTLLWELLQGGLTLRGDPLAMENGGLEALEPDAAAAIKRLVKSRYLADDGPARGAKPEDMIAMMARAHKRQCKNAAHAEAGAATKAVSAPGSGGGGGGASGADVNDDACDDEPHLYLGRHEPKSWRRTVEWMKENDWVLVKDGTDGKHYKYRRLLPNGQIQTQTVCCSPSDTLRGIRNLHAELARKDAQANTVIKAWRRKERERSKAVAAALVQ